jgi:hypothetical protein
MGSFRFGSQAVANAHLVLCPIPRTFLALLVLVVGLCGQGTEPYFAKDASKTIGLRYFVLYQVKGGAGWRTAAPTRIFRNGDKVKFQLETNVDGFVYIFMRGSSGREALLYPQPNIQGGRNRIRAFSRLNIPLKDGQAFLVTAEPGEDQITFIVSKKPLLAAGEGDAMAIRQLQGSLSASSATVREFAEPGADGVTLRGDQDPDRGNVVVSLASLLGESVFTTVTIRHR